MELIHQILETIQNVMHQIIDVIANIIKYAKSRL